MLKKDKYLSIVIVLILFLIASSNGKGIFSMIFTVIMYILFGKVVIKLASVVQEMIYDIRKLLNYNNF